MSEPLDFHGIQIEKDNPEELFELLEVLGKGTFGTVYRARNTQTDEIVAVKQILLVNDDEIDIVRREVHILRGCKHPNIVEYKGSYKSLNALWITMEDCGGGSVDSIFKIMRRPLCEALIGYIVREVVKGLIYLHGQHRIHRDIKGANILLTSDGRVKVADFGVSTELLHTLSRRNSFIGTLYWMAPEAIMEREYDERADIWSLGITIIEMAEAAPPHMGSLCGPVLFKIPKEPPPTLRHKELWSPMMHKFVARLLVKEPALRPTASQILSDPFLAESRIGAAEDMAEVVAEVKTRAEGMSTARRLGEESSSSSATFVEHGERSSRDSDSGDEAVVANRGVITDDPFNDPAFFADGTVVQLPPFSTEDLSLDELCPGTPLAPLSEVIPPACEILSGTSAADLERIGATVPTALLHSTQMLLAVLHYNRTITERRGVSHEESALAQAKVKRLGSILKSVLDL